MAAETTTAAVRLVQRMWLEPLVSSSPRASSSSWGESWRNRLIAPLSYSPWTERNTVFVHAGGEFPILSNRVRGLFGAAAREPVNFEFRERSPILLAIDESLQNTLQRHRSLL